MKYLRGLSSSRLLVTSKPSLFLSVPDMKPLMLLGRQFAAFEISISVAPLLRNKRDVILAVFVDLTGSLWFFAMVVLLLRQATISPGITPSPRLRRATQPKRQTARLPGHQCFLRVGSRVPI